MPNTGTSLHALAGLDSPAPAAGQQAVDADCLRAAMAHMPHGLCMFDADDRLVLANQRYLDIWGLPPHLGRSGTSFADIMAATQGLETEESRLRFADTAGNSTRQREWALTNGRRVRVAVTRLPNGHCVALHEDITDQHRNETQAAYLARHDVLTGLPNRAVLRQALMALYASPSRDQEVALLCLDLDQFKAVNDRFGHPAGDELLRQVGERLRHCVRDTDLVVRLGGDEFAVLQYGNAQPQGATALARRLITQLAQVFELGDAEAHIGVSVGIAVAPFDGNTPDALLTHADLALYQAKHDGRGMLRLFEPGMGARAQTRNALEADLRLALERHELELAYQVQVHAETGTASGVEALLRWNHPTRGRVTPDAFIPLAEDTGLIVPIGRWVLEQACTDAMQWPSEIRVAVNVSAMQFRQGTLLRDVSQALASSGLPASRLEVEITESVMLQEPDQALKLLHELRRRGVQVAMDDFGTGYSSLASLRSFPFDRIKIDRSFVKDLDSNPEALAIVRAVAGLGRSLGIATTVEGVETTGQLMVVQREGCGEVQGYLFSRPGPANGVALTIAGLAQPAPAPGPGTPQSPP